MEKEYIFRGTNNTQIRITTCENGNVIVESGSYNAEANKVLWYFAGQIKVGC